jgi:hypothetical protein
MDRWIPEGEICSRLASSIDLLPTVAAITGARLPENKIDGVNILPLMLGDETITPRHEFLYITEATVLSCSEGLLETGTAPQEFPVIQVHETWSGWMARTLWH